ncbi:MAG: hypothetical protein ABF649_08600 [Bacillus sp. (in: firmicutes)]
MKKIFTYSAVLGGLLLLFGCSKERVSENIHTKTPESYTVPFKMEEINSSVLKLDDTANTSLKGIRYEILLRSNEKIPTEASSSYEFEIIPHSYLKKSLGPIQSLRLMKETSSGYLYSLSLESIYQNYSEKELENLRNDRDFEFFVKHDGIRYPLTF